MTEVDAVPSAGLVEGLFRAEYSKLVAVLTRRFGLPRLGEVEDIVQETLISAMQHWAYHGVPNNPAAWLTTVAKNKAKNMLKHEGGKDRWHTKMTAAEPDVAPEAAVFLGSDIEDAQLRMMFACCHPDVGRADQLALVLKTLCGFHAREVARALLLSDEATQKRLYRAKQQLKSGAVTLEVPGGTDLEVRLAAVCQCIYLLFNEGYAPSASEEAIRRDLCSEAIRLGGLLADRFDDHPPVFALLSLMLLHAARFEARTDGAGGAILLEDQDRSLWDRSLIARGLQCLLHSAAGSTLTPFHLEASIAAQHCLAESFAETNWALIGTYYEKLYALSQNPVHLLNLSIVKAQQGHLDEAIAELDELTGHRQLTRYPLLYATLAELWRRRGDGAKAAAQLARAAKFSTSDRERAVFAARHADLEP